MRVSVESFWGATGHFRGPLFVFFAHSRCRHDWEFRVENKSKNREASFLVRAALPARRASFTAENGGGKTTTTVTDNARKNYGVICGEGGRTEKNTKRQPSRWRKTSREKRA